VAITIDQIRAPAQHGLAVVRGDSIEIVFRLVSGETGARMVLTGWGGFAAVYPAPGSSQVLLELDVVVSQDGAGLAGTGLVTVSADALDTLPLVSGVWRLVLTQGSSSKTVIAGEWCVVEPFAGRTFAATCGAPGCTGTPCSCASGSCGYSETLGQPIPCGTSCPAPIVAPAVGEVTITIGC
jgi:hypothetical protein